MNQLSLKSLLLQNTIDLLKINNYQKHIIIVIYDRDMTKSMHEKEFSAIMMYMYMNLNE